MPFIPQPPQNTDFKRKLTLPPDPPAVREATPDAADETLTAMEAAHAAMRASGKIEAAMRKVNPGRSQT